MKDLKNIVINTIWSYSGETKYTNWRKSNYSAYTQTKILNWINIIKKDSSSKYQGKNLINKASTTEFGTEAMTKNLNETFLVMVEAISDRIVDAAYVKHRIKRVQDLQKSQQNANSIMKTKKHKKTNRQVWVITN